MILNYENCMSLCHGALQRHNHRVIEVRLLTSQNVSFYISLKSMDPIYSIDKIINFFISIFAKEW